MQTMRKTVSPDSMHSSPSGWFSGTPHHTAIIDTIPIKVNIMLFCFVGALSPYLCLPFPISKSLPLFTSYFSPFTQYSSIFSQILLYQLLPNDKQFAKG